MATRRCASGCPRSRSGSLLLAHSDSPFTHLIFDDTRDRELPASAQLVHYGESLPRVVCRDCAVVDLHVLCLRSIDRFCSSAPGRAAAGRLCRMGRPAVAVDGKRCGVLLTAECASSAYEPRLSCHVHAHACRHACDRRTRHWPGPAGVRAQKAATQGCSAMRIDLTPTVAHNGRCDCPPPRADGVIHASSYGTVYCSTVVAARDLCSVRCWWTERAEAGGVGGLRAHVVC